MMGVIKKVHVLGVFAFVAITATAVHITSNKSNSVHTNNYILDTQALPPLLDTLEKNIEQSIIKKFGSLKNLTKKETAQLDSLIEHEVNTFSDSLSKAISGNLTEAQKNIKQCFSIYLCARSIDKDFYWCPCVSNGYRLSLALEIASKTHHQFPHKSEQIVYTSFCSGNLLQDYINLALLVVLGYTNLKIHAIDLEYPKNSSRVSHGSQNSFPPFTRMVQQLNELAPGTLQVELIGHHSSKHYQQWQQCNPQEKSTILIMVDPGTVSKNSVTTTINDASIYILKSSSQSDIQLFIPENTQPIAYIDPLKQNKKFIQTTLTKIKEVAELHLNKSAFIEALKKEQIINKATQFIGDAHLSFQELVQYCARPNTLVYTLHRQDFGDPNSNAIKQLDPVTYPKTEIVSTTTGTFLTAFHGCKQINFA